LAVSAEDIIAQAFSAVRERIRIACERVGRAPETVQLIAASKFQPPAAIRAAYAWGQRDFAENYVQELVTKAAELADLGELRWHLIGHLQRNKIKDVVQLGCRVQTLDSLRLAEALAARAEAARPLDVLLQVNIAREPQKAGVMPEELGTLVRAVGAMSSLRLRGLMTVPKASADPTETRAYFRSMRELASEFGLAELSMGMSADLELAIEEGATQVRVGTALFGPRRRD
jgi:pyridoxal phosphate enzyme (YggS family)